MTDIANRFVKALTELHKNEAVEPIVELFAADATLDKIGVPQHQEGTDGARAFWEQYRHDFDSVDATFRHIVSDDDVAYLEWTSEGKLREGKSFRYDGISVLEMQDGKIGAFRTYYDTTAFLGR